MKKLLILIVVGLCLVLFPSCKKTIDNQIENYVIKLLTSGNWYLDRFTENGLDYTMDFTGYQFKFYENGTIDAISPNVIESGTWSGDLANEVFTSGFPNSGYPLNRLNHSWKITDKYINVIFAEVRTSTGIIAIRFRKI